MKKSLIALAALSAVSFAFATKPDVPTPQIKNPVVTGTGSNTVFSSTAAGSYVNGAGTSMSTARNVQGASSYVGGSGSVTTKPGNAYVNINECDIVKVPGLQTTGNVLSYGGTAAWGTSTASNVSTGAGTGGAQALGYSVAEVTGKTVLTSPTMNLNAGGSAFSAVGTNSGVVGVNGSGYSHGAIQSAYNSGATGSLFTYNTPAVSGDVKEITSNSYTNVGGIGAAGGCGGKACITGPSVAVNAVVEGGANAFAGGEITYSFTK